MGPANGACMQAILVGEHARALAGPSGSGGQRRAFGSILSEAMQEFLGAESMPRTEVVKRLWAYIKEHELQDPKNKRKIRCRRRAAEALQAAAGHVQDEQAALKARLCRRCGSSLLPLQTRHRPEACMTPARQAAGTCMQVLHAAGRNHHLLLCHADRHHDEPEENAEEEDDVEISEEEDDFEEEDEEETPAKKKKAAAPRKREAAGGGVGRQRDKAEDGEAKPKRRRTSSGGQGGCELSPEMRAFLGGVPRMPRPQVCPAAWAHSPLQTGIFILATRAAAS